MFEQAFKNLDDLGAGQGRTRRRQLPVYSRRSASLVRLSCAEKG